MNLEQLVARAAEIGAAIVNMTAQLNALHGHKTEVEHWIKQHQDKENEPQVEQPAEPVVE